MAKTEGKIIFDMGANSHKSDTPFVFEPMKFNVQDMVFSEYMKCSIAELEIQGSLFLQKGRLINHRREHSFVDDEDVDNFLNNPDIQNSEPSEEAIQMAENILRPGRGFMLRDVVNCLNNKFASLVPPCEVEVAGAKVKNLPITIHDVFVNYHEMTSLNVEEASIPEICNTLQKFYPLSAKYEKVTFFINDVKVEDDFQYARYRLLLSVQVGWKKKDSLTLLFKKGRKVGRKKDNSNGA